MSNMSTEPGTPGQDESPALPVSQQLARYTIAVPDRDNNGTEIPHVLARVRSALGEAGFQGRTVIRRTEGDWQGETKHYTTEHMNLVMTDAPDTPENRQAILGIAQEIKALANQEAVWVTVQPVEAYLV